MSELEPEYEVKRPRVVVIDNSTNEVIPVKVVLVDAMPPKWKRIPGNILEPISPDEEEQQSDE
jgi:hypothetical protein